MTTIVWDGLTLAADSRRTNNEAVTGTAMKLGRVNGHLFAYCGATTDMERVRQWIQAGAVFPGPEFDGEAIVVPPKGKAYLLESKAACSLPMTLPYLAAGSGARFAQGALAVGATAVEAVKAAIRHDIYSGPPVRTLTR